MIFYIYYDWFIKLNKRSHRIKKAERKLTMINNLKLNFHLFDGDGGGDAGGSAGTEGGLGAEASNFLESLGRTKEGAQSTSSSTEPTVLYGKAAKEGEGEQGPVGEDGNTANINANSQESEADEFAKLIAKGGKFHDQYGQAISQAIQQRFKNQGDLQSTVDKTNSALAPMYQRYGIKSGDIEGLQQAIASDEDLFSAEAERQGLSVEQYRQNLQLQAEAERGRQLQQQFLDEQNRNRMYAEWDRQAGELRESFPKFDLGQEIQQNQKFADLIDNGVSVQDAFFASRAKDILSGINQESTQAARADVVNTIQQRAARPPENGIRHNAAVVRKVDPKTFTNEDMDKILADVASGKLFEL